MTGRYRRLLIAFAVSALAVMLSLFVGRQSADADAEGALLPEGIYLPDATGLVHLDGEILVDGKAVQNVVFRTAASPEEVLTFFRAYWEPRPVDFSERPIPGGGVLSVLDNHGARQWTVAATRQTDGTTEVIRGITSMAPRTGEEGLLPFDLPDEMAVASQIQDRSGGSTISTWVLLGGKEIEATHELLCDALVRSGWMVREGCDRTSRSATIPSTHAAAVPHDAGAPHDATIPIPSGVAVQALLQRGGARLSLLVGDGPMDAPWATLRMETE